jgi:hypothetical protein
MTNAQPTPEQINDLALQMYAKKAAAEKARHQQNIVPWSELSPSLKASLLSAAAKQLAGQQE